MTIDRNGAVNADEANLRRKMDAARGAAVERYTYTAYGKPSVQTPGFAARATSAYAWDSLYTGRQLDVETGLYHYRNRYYSAEMGRFVNRDPIESDPNLYAYVGTNPLVRTDSQGLSYEENCISACTAGCDEEFSWYNPQRYICQSYCDNTCTGTPDIWDQVGNSLDFFCNHLNTLPQNYPFQYNMVTCACGIAGLVDLASSSDLAEGIDCGCNVFTTIQTACARGLRGAALMAALTALDCSSTAFGALGCHVGAGIGGVVGSVPGAFLGCFLGFKFADLMIDIGAWFAQNYDLQGTVLPAAQKKACCELASGKWE